MIPRWRAQDLRLRLRLPGYPLMTEPNADEEAPVAATRWTATVERRGTRLPATRSALSEDGTEGRSPGPHTPTPGAGGAGAEERPPPRSPATARAGQVEPKAPPRRSSRHVHLPAFLLTSRPTRRWAGTYRGDRRDRRSGPECDESRDRQVSGAASRNLARPRIAAAEIQAKRDAQDRARAGNASAL